MGVLVAAGLFAAVCLLLIAGATDTANGQSETAAHAAKAKKKKKKKNKNVTVMTRNLYLGTGLTNALAKGLALGGSNSRPDGFADAVGQELRNVDTTNFNTRSVALAKEIKTKRPDLVGLQEAVLWRIQIPTDGSPLNPQGQPAAGPYYDFLNLLLTRLNAKARSKKQCKKKGINPKSSKCYRGYRLVTTQDEFDLESLADFNQDPGPDGKTFDLGESASLGAAAPSRWLEGNDDNGVSLGEPPAAQCSDGKDNDGDGLIDYGPTPGVNETSAPVLGGAAGLNPPGSGPNWDCENRLDNSETDSTPGPPSPGGGGTTDAVSLPQDINFDHNIYTFFKNGGGFPAGARSPDDGTPTCTPSAICPFGVTYDGNGNGLDKLGVNDCDPALPGPQDGSPDQGPAQGFDPDGGGAIPPWAFAGYDGDQDPAHAGSQVHVCLFHGIDMDGRITDRNAILARKGAGVKTSNASGGHFDTYLQYSLAGIPFRVLRGFNQVDANVRGKKFHFVNTHLEAFDNQATGNPTNKGTTVDRGQIRAAQAQELISRALQSPGPVVLVGDLNSNVPGVQPGDELAYQALLANGFLERTNNPASCCLDNPLLNDPGTAGLDHQVDHVMTHTPGISLKKAFQTLTFANGLWSSDHAGVVSVLRFFGGKKKK